MRRAHSWATGSWACARGVGEEFALADATADYKKMVTDFDDAGPLTRAAFMAQAYGVAASRQGSGAFRLRVHADHQGDAHVFSRTLIQYVRMPRRRCVAVPPPSDFASPR